MQPKCALYPLSTSVGVLSCRLMDKEQLFDNKCAGLLAKILRTSINLCTGEYKKRDFINEARYAIGGELCAVFHSTPEQCRVSLQRRRTRILYTEQ